MDEPERMNQATGELPDIEEIQLLTFRISEVGFAVDTEQTSEIIDLDQAKSRKLEIIRFDTKIPFRGVSVTYRTPKVLMLKNEVSRGILIDQMRTIIHAPLDSIHPLPPLVQFPQKPPPIWGAVLLEDEIILLVDGYSLLAGADVEGKK